MSVENKRMQQRYGSFSDFESNLTTLLPNELCSVNSGYPNTQSGTALFFKNGTAAPQRLLFEEDLNNIQIPDVDARFDEAFQEISILKNSVLDLSSKFQEIEEALNGFLSKSLFKKSLTLMLSTVLRTDYSVIYDGFYPKPLIGFRINKENYNPTNGDTLIVWVDNELQTPGTDYIISEFPDFWEFTKGKSISGMELSIQVWNVPQASGGVFAGASTLVLDGTFSPSVAGLAEKIEEET